MERHRDGAAEGHAGVRDRELHHGADRDPITDLADRACFLRRVAAALSRRATGGGAPPAALLLDVGGVTGLDDTFAARAGDRLLAALAERLRACLRPTDLVARTRDGGFGVLLDEVRSRGQLIEVAERMLDALGAPVTVDREVPIHPAVSLGLAIADGVDVSAEELLRRAGVAMDAATAAGQGVVGVFEPDAPVVLRRTCRPPTGTGGRTGAPRLEGEDGVRLWLARELHDDALRKLTAMLLDMEETRRALPETVIGRSVLDFQTSVRSVIGGLRRLLGDLREQPGEDDRLVDDLTALLGQLEARAGIRGELSVSPSWPASLSAHLASQLRRIAEEALQNVALHSGAGRVMVSLEAEEERLTLTVSDDGRGCLSSGDDGGPTGSGVLGMKERALLLGGHVEVSSPLGAGTTVRGTFSAKSA